VCGASIGSPAFGGDGLIYAIAGAPPNGTPPLVAIGEP
jgi:hypothetical protein